jgi:membrane protease YdiL (CAAX protease family)
MTDTPPIATDAVPPGILMRIYHFPMTRMLIGIVAFAIASIIARFVARAIDPMHGGVPQVVAATVTALIFIAVYVAFTTFIERRGNVEFALPGALPELAAGLVIGTGLFSTVVAVIAVLGGYQVLTMRGAEVLLPVVALGIVSGVAEEILLRGVFFRLVEEWLGSWAALVLSAALFGALHLGNPNATLPAGVAISLEAGIMLAAIFMVTRRLWAVIGVHAAWNFTQGGIFGIAISGGDTPGLLVPRITGPDLLTGGAFGAEASLPAMIIATAFGIGVVAYARRKGRFIAPSWLRRRHLAAAQS